MSKLNYTFSAEQTEYIESAVHVLQACLEKFGERCGIDASVVSFLTKSLAELAADIEAQHKKVWDSMSGVDVCEDMADKMNKKLLFTTRESIRHILDSLAQYIETDRKRDFKARMTNPECVDFFKIDKDFFKGALDNWEKPNEGDKE